MGRGSFANHAEVAEAMAAATLGRSNAVDVVVSGLFAYAAVEPSLLLGPVQILIGGPGAGLQAVDGRVRQPGLGAPRPRGFVPSEPIPASASVGVPCFSSAVLAALAAYGTRTVNQCVTPSVDLAKHHSDERAKVLALVARHGPTAIGRDEIAGILVERFGRMAGGLLTSEDLVASPPPVEAVPVYKADGNGGARAEFALMPHAAGTDERKIAGSLRLAMLLAVDTHGLFCAAAAEVHADAIAIDELGLAAPRLADPVRRGEPRVTPGTARPSGAPIALVGHRGAWELALATSGPVDRALARAVALLDSATAEAPAEPAPPMHVLFASGSVRTL